jgi:hypothetical protein
MTDWPDCPDCGTDVFVSGAHSYLHDYQCYACDEKFEQRVGR